MQLFRQQALDAQRYRLCGEVFLWPRPSHTFTAVFLVAWFAALVLWLGKGTYASKETVQGWLQPIGGVTRISAPASAVVEQVLVSEGDEVVAGQPLLVLRQQRTLASGKSLEQTLLEQLEIQKRTIEQRLQRSAQNFQQLSLRTKAELEAAQRGLSHTEHQAQSLEQQQRLLAARARRHQQLADADHIPDVAAEESKLLLLDASHNLQALRRDREELRSRVSHLESELALLPHRQAEAGDKLRFELSEITQRIVELSGSGTFTVTAGQEGIVHNLQARIGQQAGLVAGPLVTIVPRDGTLEAQLLVPVRAVGFLKPGQQIKIQYHTFPHQKFGKFRGTITDVAASALLAHEVDANPLTIQGTVYRVSATIAKQEIHANGLPVRLRPGMTFSADITLDHRSILQWLLGPIYALNGRLA
jgi:membrane fusion protein